MTTFETRQVLAAAYVNLDACLTHVVECDQEGNEVRVLCKRVKLDIICDSMAGDVAAIPSCRTCRNRDPRMKTRK